MPAGFFSAIKAAAASPQGLVAFVVLAVVWAGVEIAQYRLRYISKIIKSVPERDRPALLAREYSTFPKSALSPEQWIRSRQNQNRFYTILALILAITVIGITALQIPRASKVEPARPIVTPGNAETRGNQSPAITGNGNQVSYGPTTPPEANSKTKKGKQ